MAPSSAPVFSLIVGLCSLCFGVFLAIRRRDIYRASLVVSPLFPFKRSWVQNLFGRSPPPVRVLTVSGIPRADIDIVLPITIFITNRSRKTVKNPKLFLSYNCDLLMQNEEISAFSSNVGAEAMGDVKKRYLEIRRSQIAFGHTQVEFRLPSIDPGQPSLVMDVMIIRNDIRKIHGIPKFPLDRDDSTTFVDFLPEKQDLSFVCYVEATVYAEDLSSWSSFFFIIGYFGNNFERSIEAPKQVAEAFWLSSGRNAEVAGIYFRPWIPFIQADTRVKARMLMVKPQFGFVKRDNKNLLTWDPKILTTMDLTFGCRL